MENFQDFLREYGPQQFATSLPIQLVINTIIMWLVANHLLNLGGKVSIVKCFICTLLLCIVSAVAIAVLLFPIPLVFILSFLIFIVGSLVVIQSIFQLTEGGFAILFFYILILVLISIGVHHLR